MEYKALKSLYYQSKEEYERVYEARLNGESTYRTNFLLEEGHPVFVVESLAQSSKSSRSTVAKTLHKESFAKIFEMQRTGRKELWTVDLDAMEAALDSSRVGGDAASMAEQAGNA